MYQGAMIAWVGENLRVFDSSFVGQSIHLRPQDFVGQATWVSPTEIQFNTVMRADIAIGDQVIFPQQLNLLLANTFSSNSAFRNLSTFTGPFQVIQIVHTGSSRQPDAQSWITSFKAVGQPMTTTNFVSGLVTGVPTFGNITPFKAGG
jgi:hypothetical protein